MPAPHQTLHKKHLLARAALAALGLAGSAQAFEIDTGVPDFKILWDTTVKYSTAARLRNPSQQIVGGANYDSSAASYFPNTDDGSRNFKRGLISNRLDIFSELDISYGGVGARMSAAGWYDSVYQSGRNDNSSAGTANPYSVDADQFTATTKRLHGRDAELLDAFVFAKGKLGDMAGAVRLGKHTLLYGESLMLGANGIAAAQAPIDVIKAATVPNAQFKEFMMPVNQVSGQLQITPDVTVGGYYMLEWKKDRLPASGSYFSGMDAVGPGGERLIVGYSPAGNVYFLNQPDMKADKPQFGLQARFHVGETDLGLYAVQWNDHGPSGLYLHPYAGAPSVDAKGMQVGTYQWVFHEGIRAVGASFNTTVGNVNLGGEMSLRSNTPFDSDAQADTSGADNNGNPLYAVGKSAHAQVNWIASIGPSFLAREADFVGELGWNRRLSVDKNAAAMNPNADRDSAQPAHDLRAQVPPGSAGCGPERAGGGGLRLHRQLVGGRPLPGQGHGRPEPGAERLVPGRLALRTGLHALLRRGRTLHRRRAPHLPAVQRGPQLPFVQRAALVLSLRRPNHRRQT